MNQVRIASNPLKESVSSAPAGADGPLRGWTRFWFTPTDPLAFHILRLLCGLMLLAWLMPFGAQVESLYGLKGLFDQEARADLVRLGFGFRPSTWSLLYISSNAAWPTVVYWFSIAALALFTLGIWTRLTAVLTWIVVASFTDNPALDYGADAVVSILAFYMMIGHLLLGQGKPGQSLAYRLLGPLALWPLARRRNTAPAEPSLAANLAVRLLQVHVAIVFVTTGLHKLQIADWWQGVALWYRLHPPMETTAEELRSIGNNADGYFIRLSLATYTVLAWEIGFPLFAWRRSMRIVLVAGGVVALFGMAFLYHMPTFGPALFIGCVSFITSEEWRRWFGRLTRLPGLTKFAGEPVHAGGAGDARAESAPALVSSGRR